MPNHTLDFRLDQLEQQTQKIDNPNGTQLVADNVWEWIQKYRPNVGGKKL